MRDRIEMALAILLGTPLSLVVAAFVAVVVLIMTSPFWAIGLIALKYIGWI